MCIKTKLSTFMSAFMRRDHNRFSRLRGRMFAAFYLDGTLMFLRMQGSVARMDLENGRLTFVRPEVVPYWVALPGWIRIRRVHEQKSQIQIEVGELYFNVITIRRSKREWCVVFPRRLL